MLISSKIEKEKYIENILIKKDKENGLDRNSIAKTDVLYKINPDNILFKIGEVDKKRIEEYKNNFIKLNK